MKTFKQFLQESKPTTSPANAAKPIEPIVPAVTGEKPKYVHRAHSFTGVRPCSKN